MVPVVIKAFRITKTAPSILQATDRGELLFVNVSTIFMKKLSATISELNKTEIVESDQNKKKLLKRD